MEEVEREWLRQKELEKVRKEKRKVVEISEDNGDEVELVLQIATSMDLMERLVMGVDRIGKGLEVIAEKMGEKKEKEGKKRSVETQTEEVSESEGMETELEMDGEDAEEDKEEKEDEEERVEEAGEGEKEKEKEDKNGEK